MSSVHTAPFIYETVILVFAFFFDVLIVKHNLKKKSKLTTLLMYQFIFYTIAITSSWYGKYLRLINEEFPTDLVGINLYFIRLIWDFRLALAMISIGIIFSYKFKVELFDSDHPNKLKNQIFVVLGILISLFSVLLYERNVNEYSLIVFALLFLYNVIVYIPIMFKAMYLAKRIEEKVHKKAIYAIGFMAWSLIAIFLSFLLDQAMLVLFQTRFSIFYYLAWVWAIMGLISSYYGYIKPSK